MNRDMRPSMGENACTLENMVLSRVQAFSPIVLRDPVTIWLRQTGSATMMILGCNNSPVLLCDSYMIIMAYCELFICRIIGALWALRLIVYVFCGCIGIFELEWASDNPCMARAGIEPRALAYLFHFAIMAHLVLHPWKFTNFPQWFHVSW